MVTCRSEKILSMSCKKTSWLNQSSLGCSGTCGGSSPERPTPMEQARGKRGRGVRKSVPSKPKTDRQGPFERGFLSLADAAGGLAGLFQALESSLSVMSAIASSRSFLEAMAAVRTPCRSPRRLLDAWWFGRHGEEKPETSEWNESKRKKHAIKKDLDLYQGFIATCIAPPVVVVGREIDGDSGNITLTVIVSCQITLICWPLGCRPVPLLSSNKTSSDCRAFHLWRSHGVSTNRCASKSYRALSTSRAYRDRWHHISSSSPSSSSSSSSSSSP
eukprot:763089-Hanusia_phi.AAC.3